MKIITVPIAELVALPPRSAAWEIIKMGMEGIMKKIGIVLFSIIAFVVFLPFAVARGALKGAWESAEGLFKNMFC